MFPCFWLGWLKPPSGGFLVFWLGRLKPPNVCFPCVLDYLAEAADVVFIVF